MVRFLLVGALALTLFGCGAHNADAIPPSFDDCKMFYDQGYAEGVRVTQATQAAAVCDKYVLDAERRSGFTDGYKSGYVDGTKKMGGSIDTSSHPWAPPPIDYSDK